MVSIQQNNITDQVYAILRGKIGENAIRFGERLHIRKLATELGVSPTPVREALNRLLAAGLAVSEPRRGLYFFHADANVCPAGCAPRLCVEQYIAPGVIARATGEDIRRLYGLAEELVSKALNALEWKPTSFHSYYAILSGNRVLIRWHQQALGPLNVLFARGMATAGQEALLQHAEEEKAICAAIEARDVESLRQAIAQHMYTLQGMIRQYIFGKDSHRA